MPTLSGGIHLALQAVLAHAQTIEVIEHNVANANTPGYRRQSAMLSAAVPTPMYAMDHGFGAGQLGSGVIVERIQRFNLDFFDGRYRTVTAESSNWEVQSGILTQIEATLAEVSSDGLLAKLDRFWTAWQNLSADPSNPSLRSNVLEEASFLVGAFNRRADQLNQIRSDQNLAIASRVSEVNGIARQIAGLNKEITRVLSVGEQPNDLLDKRDLLLDRLSALTGGASTLQENGSVIVSVGGHVLVTGNDAVEIKTELEPVSRQYKIVWADGQSFKATSGELKGLLNVRDELIPRLQQGLDEMAATLAERVNAVHASGYGMDNSTGLNFFTGTGALDMRLNVELTATNLAVASNPDEPGNGLVAAQLAELQGEAMMAGGTQTLAAFYNNQVTQLGFWVQNAKDRSYHNGLVAQALSEQRESVAGVSLDEEAANLVKAQRAYQAAARVMTVYDELLDLIINGMGLAGR